MKKKILIVEDEKNIVDILAFNLNAAGFDTEAALDGETGLKRALEGSPDLILLDVMLPLMDGFEVCRRIRQSEPTVPVVMLTAREEEADKIFGLELGADDYVTKPFSMPELIARLKANLRRTTPNARPQPVAKDDIVSGDLVISPARQEIRRGGEPVALSKREYDLLYFLASHPDHVFSREELMERVWNYDFYGDLRAVDVTVRRLREKTEQNPAEPRHIQTRRGAGYLFSAR